MPSNNQFIYIKCNLFVNPMYKLIPNENKPMRVQIDEFIYIFIFVFCQCFLQI